MAIRRFVVSLETLDDARDEFLQGDVLDVTNGDAVMMLAALGPTLDVTLGLWLRVDEQRPAVLAARDLATLTHLVDVGLVVIEASERAEAQADVVRALFSADEVNFANEITTIRGAYNRPAPARPLEVASSDGLMLYRGGVVYAREVQVPHAWGEIVTYSS